MTTEPSRRNAATKQKMFVLSYAYQDPDGDLGYGTIAASGIKSEGKMSAIPTLCHGFAKQGYTILVVANKIGGDILWASSEGDFQPLTWVARDASGKQYEESGTFTATSPKSAANKLIGIEILKKSGREITNIRSKRNPDLIIS